MIYSQPVTLEDFKDPAPTKTLREVKATFFKESGKYYTSEVVAVPRDFEVHEICDGFRDLSLFSGYADLPYVYLDAASEDDDKMYPCLVIRGERKMNLSNDFLEKSLNVLGRQSCERVVGLSAKLIEDTIFSGKELDYLADAVERGCVKFPAATLDMVKLWYYLRCARLVDFSGDIDAAGDTRLAYVAFAILNHLNLKSVDKTELERMLLNGDISISMNGISMQDLFKEA